MEKGTSGGVSREEVQPGAGGLQGTIKRGRFKVKRVPSGAQEDLARLKRSNLKRNNLRHSKDIMVALKVTVYNISPMLPISRDLATMYQVLDDPVAMCKYNSSVAAELGKLELAQIWQLAGQVNSLLFVQPPCHVKH